MDNQQLDLFLDPVIDIYLDMERSLIENIANRLKTDPGDFDSSGLQWRVRKLAQMDALNIENLKVISKKSGRGLAELWKAMKKAGLISAAQYEKGMREAYDKGLLFKIPAAVSADTRVLNVLAAMQARASESLNLVNTTILRNAQQAYLDVLNRTVAKTATGVLTPEAALYETASEWAASGIPALIDQSGRKWQIETYVRMVGRTIVQQTTNDMQFARMDSWGADLIEVSSHAGARPLCAPYQGRIYSRSGTSSKYRPFSSTSYGLKAGLFGINCGHFGYPYIEGVSMRTYHPYPAAENRRIYEQSQQQRALERDIRKWKRKASVAESLGDTKTAKTANKKVRDKQELMRDFIKKTGRTRRYNREQIVPPGTKSASPAKKTAPKP